MADADYTPVKRCKTCLIEKPWSEFHKWPNGSPRAHCGECANAARRTGTARRMTFTAIGKICTKCGEDKPLSDFKLKSKESGRYRSACKACEYKTTMSWNERNRDRVCAHVSKWKSKSSGQVKAMKGNRRARKADADGTHSAADIEKILELQKHRCAYCRCSIKKARHIDHKVPLKLGGGNDPSNLQALCPKCNLSKGAKDPLLFANSLGLLL